MLLRYAETFRDVAALRSFSRAAKARGLSQPAVSQAIHQLEEYLGVSLFDRSTRPLELTPAGQTYFDGCQELLDQFEQLEDSVRQIGTKIVGRVRVAAIYSVGLLEMSVLLADFEQNYPEVEVVLDYVHPDEVYQHVRSGDADFGIVSHPRCGGEWESTLWRTQEMVIVTSPSHPLAKRKEIDLAELAGERFVALTPELASRVEIDRTLKQAGVKVEIAHQFDNIDTIRRAVTDGAGVSILPAATIQREVEAGTIAAIAISGQSITRPVGVLRKRNGSLSSAAKAFMASLLESPPRPVGLDAADREPDAAKQHPKEPSNQSDGIQPPIASEASQVS